MIAFLESSTTQAQAKAIPGKVSILSSTGFSSNHQDTEEPVIIPGSPELKIEVKRIRSKRETKKELYSPFASSGGGVFRRGPSRMSA